MINRFPNEKPKMIEPYTDNEILEIMKVLGFQEQNKLLWEKGFTDLRKNLKLLRAYSGDVNLILDKIAQIPSCNFNKKLTNENLFADSSEKEKLVGFSSDEKIKCDKMARIDCYKQLKVIINKGCFRKPKEMLLENEKILIEIIEAGYVEQNLILIDHGFLCYAKNLETLKEFQGDLPKSIARLGELYKKYEEEIRRYKLVKQYKDKAKMRMLQELNNLGYMDGYKKLILGGQTKLTKNYQNLIYYNGDANKILKNLEIEARLKYYEDKVGIKFQKRIDKINDNIDTFILDGTSSLCADETAVILLRSKQKAKAEKLVAITAKKFSSKNQGFHCIIVFDQAEFACEKLNISEKSKFLSFNIYNAKPKYNSTDEAILGLLATKTFNLKNTMFVTNNTELAASLLENGVTEIITSANWFMLAKKAIGMEEFYKFSNPSALGKIDV